MGVSCQLHAPVALLPKEKKTVYPANRRPGWPRIILDTAEKRKITVSAGNLTPVLQLSNPQYSPS